MKRVFFLMLAVAACGGTNPTATVHAPPAMPGAYVLKTVLGQPVPYTFVLAGHPDLAYIADTIRVFSGNSYVEHRWIRLPTGPTVYLVEMKGQWSLYNATGAHFDSYDPSDHFGGTATDTSLDVNDYPTRSYARCPGC